VKYLLDTDICIYLIKNKPPSVIQRLQEVANEDVAISTVTLFELQHGVENSQHREQASMALSHFVSSIHHILPVEEVAARYAATIRADLKRKGMPIGPYDVLIAAVALANDLILVSNNVREFERVNGLSLENWAK
jgi:tRNA(fMet)-specific endonuclease VapC